MLGRALLGALLVAGANTVSAAGGAGGGGNSNLTTATAQPAAVAMSTATGSTSSVTVSLFDSGSPLLTISAITLSGPQAADYRLSGTCGPGVVVNRSVGPCSIVVTFTPGALGARAATISATFANAPALSVALNGTGIPPTPTTAVINITNIPASGLIDFGSEPTNILQVATSALLNADFVVTDIGGGVLMLSEALIGANPADFSFNGQGIPRFATCQPSGSFLSAAQTGCQIAVVFLPTTLGTRTATLRITTNDPNRPTIDVQLTGVGTPPVAVPPPPPPVGFTDVTGLWGTTAEPGWALNVYHHSLGIFGPPNTDAVIAYWTTYDTTGQAVWFELKDGTWTDAHTFTGNVHRFTGSPFTGPYLQSQLVDTIVGTATLSFTDTATGTLSFTINGFSGSKAITRNPFTF